MRRRQLMKGLALALCLALAWGLGYAALAAEASLTLSAADYPVKEEGRYNTLEEVAVYLAVYGRLPENFLTKKEAQALGWDSRAGNLDEVAPGCAIGGDRFGNYEALVPSAKGRTWQECDIHYAGGYRGGERLVFSNDGLIYYTADHYQHFTQVTVSLAEAPPAEVFEGWDYTAKDEVAAYLYQFGELPFNYLTKDEARALGWSSRKNNLGQIAPGYAIGGDIFQNREGLLPKKKGRVWRECEVNTQDGERGKERLVFSSDGLIYYTPDGYKTFEQLY